MINLIKGKLRQLTPQKMLNLRHRIIGKRQLKKWQRKGESIKSPYIVKEMTIREYQRKYGITTLIETGTYRGDMVEAQKKIFKKIISLELGIELFKKAQTRFINDKNVIIMQGDSGKILHNVLKDVNERSIFWLDGHYSAGVTAMGDKECPIYEELDAIFNNNKYNHILLIDDARCFNGKGDYPTIDKLTKYVKNKNEKYQVEVKYDIIRVCP